MVHYSDFAQWKWKKELSFFGELISFRRLLKREQNENWLNWVEFNLILRLSTEWKARVVTVSRYWLIIAMSIKLDTIKKVDATNTWNSECLMCYFFYVTYLIRIVSESFDCHRFAECIKCFFILSVKNIIHQSYLSVVSYNKLNKCSSYDE